jgi:type I restriction enzyme S subunit
MRQGWEIKTLNQISENLDSKRIPITKNIRSGGNIPYYGASGIVDYVEDYIFDEDLLLISEDGANLLARTYPIAFSITGKTWVNNHAHVIKFRNKTTQKFAELYLNSIKLDDFVSGMAQPKLNQSMLNKIQFPLPPPPEQQRIVAILDEAFASVVKAKANAEQNLKNAKELFESYLQSVFANKGEGWEEKTLGEVCEFVRGPFGGSLKKNIFKPDGYAIYEQQHAIYNQFNDMRYFIDEKKFNEMKRFELNTGDLIMSCSGTMGKTAIVPKNIKKGIINQALLKLTPSKKLSVVFLKLWMQSENFQDRLKEHSQGAAIQNVASVKILKGIKIPLPNLIAQQSIVQKLEALSSETQKLNSIYQQKLNDLEELKKSILKKAFNGEL